MIGIPTLGRPVNLDWALAFKALNPPINYNVNFSIIKGQEIGAAREEFVRQAIIAEAKYLFMLGDDVIIPPHTLRQLIFRMENDENVGVVGGVYCSKTEVPAPLIFKGNGQGSYWDWKIGEYFDCTGMGMDCTLLRVSMLKCLTAPRFKTVDEDSYIDGINKAEAWTEDLYFCRKVLEETSFRIKIDTSIICDHFDVYTGKVYNLPKNSLPFRQKITAKDKKCLILGPRIDLVDESYDVITCTDNGSYSTMPPDFRVAYDNLPFDDKQFDWVIFTEARETMKFPVKEWQRVAKNKISINIHPWLNSVMVAEYYKGTVDGSFVEINVGSPT